MHIVETERLILQKLTLEDADFIYELVNDPDWIKYIGDRNVRNLDDARKYISDRIIKSYEQFGFGLYLVKEKETGLSTGLCGLLKRDYLNNPDIGFALLPQFRGKGYIFESASAVIEYGKKNFGIKKLSAITQTDNLSSIKALNNLGFKFSKNIKPPDEEEEINLFENVI